MQIGIIATSLMVVYVTLDIIYDQALWNINTSVTVYLQANQFSGEEFIFHFFSYLLYALPIIALVAFLVKDDKLSTLMYVSMIVFAAASDSLIKNMYHQPRPYMVESNIQALECTAEYGKPSGHAMTSIVQCFLLPAILFPGIYKHQLQDSANYPLIIRVVVISMLSLCVGMTGVARVFLGVHSIGQVLLGWVYGLYFMIMYMTYAHQPIRNYLISRLIPGAVRLTNTFTMISIILLIAWIIVSTLLLEANIKYFVSLKNVQDWLLAADTCYGYAPGTLTPTSPTILYNANYFQSMIIGIVFGFVIAIQFSNGTYENEKFRLNYQNLTIKNKIIRVVLIFPIIIILIPLLYIDTQNVYIIAFCQELLASFIVGFGLIYIYSKLLHLANVAVPGDFLNLSTDGYNQAKYNDLLKIRDQSIQLVVL